MSGVKSPITFVQIRNLTKCMKISLYPNPLIESVEGILVLRELLLFLSCNQYLFIVAGERVIISTCKKLFLHNQGDWKRKLEYKGQQNVGWMLYP